MEVKGFFDARTFTVTYVVYDPHSRDAVIIDPVLDYDPKSSTTWTESADAVLGFVAEGGLRVHYILETHAHADHLSGSQYLQAALPGAKVGIGARIQVVQAKFKKLFNLPDSFATDGSQFDLLLADGQALEAGTITVNTLFTPGHTPACVTYQVEDAIFTGDLLFMPDYGTGRCDFPSGSARDMFRSIVERIYTLPAETRVFVGHDYLPGGREALWESTVGEEKCCNVMLRDGVPLETFVAKRESRDRALAAPVLLLQSVQVNIDAGRLPAPEPNGISYLKVPVNLFKPKTA
jgi:glyoxylase-like metal-dependent hydrolase (beta-lactamase superfamily II)